MCLNSRFMFDLPHYQARDGPALTLHALPMMQSKWDRLTMVEMIGIRTTSELIERVEKSYSLSHEQVTGDVEFWALISSTLLETRMSERIGRLCDELRIKLHGMDRRLEVLKSNGAATFDQSQEVLESQLERVEQRIYDNRVTVEAANVRVKTWLMEKKAGTARATDLWTERHNAHRLEARADDAEAYAIAVFELAAAAADEAVLAVLQALLARNDADSAALSGIDTRPAKGSSQRPREP